MSDNSSASRETDTRIAEVLGHPVKHLAVINGGPKRGRCPHYTTAGPNDWSVVGEMVAWLRGRGVCIQIEVHPCRDAANAFAAYGLGEYDNVYAVYCASPGHAVAQVLLQVVEQEKADE